MENEKLNGPDLIDQKLMRLIELWIEALNRKDVKVAKQIFAMLQIVASKLI